MSDQLDGSAGVSADVAVAEAVARAVREGGHRVSGEPRRVQGMVNDVLGAQSRTRRAEVDAVVLAAEESVPEDLLTGRVTVDEAVDRLHGRGLDEGVALFAIDVWRYALGMLGSNSEPPSLRNTLESSQPSVTDPIPLTDTMPMRPSGSLPTSVEVVAATLLPKSDTDEAPTSVRRRPRWLIGAAAGVVVMAVLAVAVFSRSDDEPEPEAAMPTTVEPTTTVFVPASVDFATESTDVGDVARSWTADGTAVNGTLSFTNTSDEAISGTHFEVIPGSMASQAAAIVSTPEHTVVIDAAAPYPSLGAQTDVPRWQVVSYPISLDPGATAEVSYRIDEGVEVTPEMLDAWKAERESAAGEFAGIRDLPPSLTIATPTGTLFTTQTVTITGTTDPTATVSFKGNPVEVNADGTWAMVGDLPAGTWSVAFLSTSRFGVEQARAVAVSVQLPISLSIDGPTLVVGGSDAQGNECEYRFTPQPGGFVPDVVDWGDGDLSNGDASMIFTFTGAGPFTINVTATTFDGRTVESSHTVEVVASGAASC